MIDVGPARGRGVDDMALGAYRFEPMNAKSAREVAGWRYAGYYAMYNLDAVDAAALIASMADPASGYFAIYDGDDLIGHCVFGEGARVPGGEYTACDYTADALDFGLGMGAVRRSSGV
jgi:hypothetical protein